jgi:hypothetical protein
MTPELNLDCLTPAELMSLWNQTNSVRPIACARKWFPTCPKGYVRATKDLGHYAANKATAMELRIEGKIQTALMYEGICDRIYAELPDYAKW